MHYSTQPKAIFTLAMVAMASFGLHVNFGHAALPQVAAPAGWSQSSVYIGADVLAQAKIGSIAVIVSGQNSSSVAQAVTHAGGKVTDELWIIDGVSAVIDAAALQALQRQPGLRSITQNQQVSVSKSKSPGQSDKKAKLTTSVPWPMINDIGANTLHDQNINGANVTVAVVDSGVFFSPELLVNYNYQDMLKFVGQANFVNGGLCTRKTLLDTSIQFADHCFQSFLYSTDRFGHGSHVTGIIGNRYIDEASGSTLGVAPEAAILSVRVLDDKGIGTYAEVIRGIQYVVEKKALFNIRVMNLSLSAQATVPYFVDPLNRAVEKAWQAGIVVVAAAGNEGPNAQTITVPGNDPYVITVGALNSQRTAGMNNWADDVLPAYSATGPTLDGFIKPDVLAPGSSIVSFMYNNPDNKNDSAILALNHPEYSQNTSLFRMSGTSMATAVASGMAAMMIQAQPNLTPDQVKFRMQFSARPAFVNNALALSPLQQGVGRIWAPDAVLGAFPAMDRGNDGMNLSADLQHGTQVEDLPFHYQGPVRQMASDQGQTTLYFIGDSNAKLMALGATNANHQWLTRAEVDGLNLTWNKGSIGWPAGSSISTNGGYVWNGGGYAWNGGGYAWNGGGYAWNGGGYAWNGGGYAWNGSTNTSAISATRWVDEH